MSDFYEILEVQKSASPEEIQKAYRKAATKYHPDINKDSDSISKFKKIQEAYDTLSDPQKKSSYDNKNFFQTRNNDQGTNYSFSFDRVMKEFFGSSSYRGANIHMTVSLSLEEVCYGCQKTINVKRKIKCNTCGGLGYSSFVDCTHCNGTGNTQIVFANSPFEFTTACINCNATGKTGKDPCQSCQGKSYVRDFSETPLIIKIPPGVENNVQLRYAEHGESPIFNGNAGDLIVKIIVKEHHIFTRNGNDLFVDIPVTYTELVLGCKLLVPTLHEGFVEVKIPAGTSSHTKFKLKEKGICNEIGKIGNLIVTVKLDTPKKLSSEYKSSIEHLVQFEKDHVSPKRELWTSKLNKYRGEKDE